MKKIIFVTNITFGCALFTHAIQPRVTEPQHVTPLETNVTCNDKEKIVIVVNNPTNTAFNGRATYKLQISAGMRLNPSPNPHTLFTIPADSYNVLVCLDKDKKGTNRLGVLESVSFTTAGKSITKKLAQLEQGTITLQ